MKCKQCGTEFTGNYCPECGAKNEELYPQIVPKKLNILKRNKRPGVKKPFYKKWWFYIILLLVISNMMRAITSGNKKTETKDYEEIAWDTVVLRNNLPNPPTKAGTLYINTDEQLWLYLNEVTEDKYYNYLDECISKGFTIDQEKIMDSFNAYNSEGYFLNLSYYDNEIRLDLKAPMKLSDISWPISKLGSLLPVPKSLIGKFEYEQEDGFYVYIGETSKEDYDQYVRDCSANGFTVNYYKEEKYYTAENPEGCSLVLEYVGNNIMSISIESPKEKQDANEQLETAEPIVNNESGESVEQVDENGLRIEFKEAMDSYEAFIDKYVEFMETYDENDASMMMKYLEFVDSYYDMTAKFDAWESKDLNDAELSYYIDVQARTNKKLINISIAE